MSALSAARRLRALKGTALLIIAAAAHGAPSYRDLNHNNHLDPYEDSGLSAQIRTDDLIKRMTLEEKVGAMMHDTLPGLGAAIGASSQGYDLPAAEKLIVGKYINSFLTRLNVPPSLLAEQNNAIQKMAEGTRLGIPVTLSTDPRNHFQYVLGASSADSGFSLWPEPLGFGAIGDPAVVRRFGDIARQEYRAAGIHVALSPQADLATEPRWPRMTGTFGSRAELVSSLVQAYVEGFQNGSSGVGPSSVAVVVKHWVGYGAEPDGFDAHNYYGRIVRLTDKSFATHVAAFDGAFAAHVAGVMPAYPIVAGVSLNGKPLEPVAPGFNRQLLTDLLRGEKHFDGLVLSDWAITRDCDETCVAPTASRMQQPTSIATPWGVETLSRRDRFAKGVQAGLDQFGGTGETQILLEAVHAGLVSEARLDESVRRIMILKFQLGLFENPYVDAAGAAAVVGNSRFQAEADEAQRRAQVIIENRGGILPLAARLRKVWLYRVDAGAARRAGLTVVSDLRAADVAILRVSTPFERLHPYHFFGQRQNEGRLDFRDGDADYEAIKKAAAVVPTVVFVDLDRAAILTNVRDKARAIVGTFGASDAAVLDVVTGKARTSGRLPFEFEKPSIAGRLEKQ